MSRKRSICTHCNRVIPPNDGVGSAGKRVHSRCAKEIPVDLVIERGKSRIEVRTQLLSRRQLQKIARLFITDYNR